MMNWLYCIVLTLALLGVASSIGVCQPTAPDWVCRQAVVDVSDVKDGDLSNLANWVEAHGKSPLDFLVDKCKEHPLVILGEMHECRDNLLFLKTAIPDLYKRAGVNCLALEVCNADDNEKLNRLVTAAQYDEAAALEIARSNNLGVWGWKEYWNLLRAVWELNSHIPSGGRTLRVIGIDRKMSVAEFAQLEKKIRQDMRAVAIGEKKTFTEPRDQWMAENIGTEVLDKAERCVALVGTMHSYTRYRLTGWPPRMGKILYDKYGDKVFQVTLHQRGLSASDPQNGFSAMAGVIEGIMAKRGSKPVGFDVVASPFALLRDETDLMYVGRPEIRSSDVDRGYIFLAPLAKTRHCKWIPGFITPEVFEANKDSYEARFGRKFSSAEEINKLMAPYGKDN